VSKKNFPPEKMQSVMLVFERKVMQVIICKIHTPKDGRRGASAAEGHLHSYGEVRINA